MTSMKMKNSNNTNAICLPPAVPRKRGQTQEGCRKKYIKASMPDDKTKRADQFAQETGSPTENFFSVNVNMNLNLNLCVRPKSKEKTTYSTPSSKLGPVSNRI